MLPDSRLVFFVLAANRNGGKKRRQQVLEMSNERYGEQGRYDGQSGRESNGYGYGDSDSYSKSRRADDRRDYRNDYG